MRYTRDFRDNTLTETEILSAGFHLAGLSGLGNSFFLTIETKEGELTAHLWKDKVYYRYHLYESTWPKNPRLRDSGSLTNWDDLTALVDLMMEQQKPVLLKPAEIRA